MISEATTRLKFRRSVTSAEKSLVIRDPFLWKQLFESDRLDEVEALVASGALQEPVVASEREGVSEAVQAIEDETSKDSPPEEAALAADAPPSRDPEAASDGKVAWQAWLAGGILALVLGGVFWARSIRK